MTELEKTRLMVFLDWIKLPTEITKKQRGIITAWGVASGIRGN